MYEKWLQEVVYISRYAIRYLDKLELPEKPAIIFDIDNTLLDSNFNMIKPVVILYNYAEMLGIFPVIVTSRESTEQVIQKTSEQLRDIGIVKKFIYFRKPYRTDIWSFKRASRKNVEEHGYKIVMSVGDSMCDITNGYVGLGIKIPRFKT